MMAADGFHSLMGAALGSAAEAEPSTTFGIWADGSLAYWNEAWLRMAEANGGAQMLSGWRLGRSIWDAVPEVMRPFYEAVFSRALESGCAVEHDYECSSPTQHRLFRMLVHPLGREGLLLRSHLLVETPHPASATGAPLSIEPYAGEHGFTAMCANCRRTRRAHGTDVDVWDWVPAFVAKPPAPVTHAICPTCLEIYYPA